MDHFRLDAFIRFLCMALFAWAGLIGLGGCGTNTPGRMEWVQPVTSTPRVGTVYCFRGWEGVYSAGIDAIAKQLNEKGVTAYPFMPEQFPEVAKTIIERYRNVPNHEPICFIGHSRGVDAALLVARELERAGIAVEMICTLDSVDETTVPGNVKVCHNYWMPGVFGNSNLLRGIPLKQAPGSTGKLYNYNMDKEYSHWRWVTTDHVTFDDDPMVQERIVGNLLEACVPRAQWRPSAAGAPVNTGSSGAATRP